MEQCRRFEEHFFRCHVDARRMHFLKVMTGDLSDPMILPKKFIESFHGVLLETVELKVPSGDIWHVGLRKMDDGVAFEYGWRNFIEDHDIKENDTLVFKYDGDSSFVLLMFDRSGYEKASAYCSKRRNLVFDLCETLGKSSKRSANIEFPLYIDEGLSQVKKTSKYKKQSVPSNKKKTLNVTSSNSIQVFPALRCDSRSSFSSLNEVDKKKFVSVGKSLNENRCHMPGKRHLHLMSSQSGKIFLRKGPFPSAKVLASSEKRGSSNTNCRASTTSSYSGLRTGKTIFKRIKSSLRGTSFLRSNKPQHVVLLDNDVELMEPIRDAFDERKEAKIYYPSRYDPQRVELSCSDMKCLEQGQYLSSTIINFYILYLQRPLSPINNPKGEYYFFNTYFYGKLEEVVLSTDESTSRFSKLRRWWKGINIFQKTYIFLPIHRDLHWSLVIISFPPKDDESCPIILHLDSLGLHNSKKILEVVQSYLIEEWKYMNQYTTTSDVLISEKIWVDLPRKIEKKEIEVPQQKNAYDCGLFVLYFMERFIEVAPERLKGEDLGMFGSKWFEPKDASGLRKRIKDLLMEEFESASGREEDC